MSLFVAHIGVGKTGTTSLQNNLFARHSGLTCIGRPNHGTDQYRRFYHALRQNENRLEAIEHIEKFLDNSASRAANAKNSNDASQSEPGKTLILSDENLCGPAPINSVMAERLHAVRPDAHILITIRNQLTAIPSYFSHDGRMLKGVPKPYNGKAVGFDDFFDHAIDNSEQSFFQFLSYHSLYEIFRRVFGEDQVHVLTFEHMVGDREKFAHELSDLLHIDKSETAELLGGKVQNTRASGRKLQYQNLRSRLLPGRSLASLVPGGALIRKTMWKFIDSGKANEVNFSSEQKQLLIEKFGEENRRLASATGLDLKALNYPL